MSEEQKNEIAKGIEYKHCKKAYTFLKQRRKRKTNIKGTINKIFTKKR